MREKEFLPLVRGKLGIERLNEMQEKSMGSASESCDIVLLSPTGSGKTLAFALPVLKMMKPSTGRIQCVVIAPSRELVVQIAGVMRQIAAGMKVTALYGGHKVEDEVNSLRSCPDIVVATPGRLLDHAVRRNLDLLPVRILVLDEFDKSLELGFDEEMGKLVRRMKNVSRTILTSATESRMLPDYLNLVSPVTLDFRNSKDSPRERMTIRRAVASSRDKLDDLLVLLRNVTGGEKVGKTIIFVNHRESAERVFRYLRENNVDAALYHGALDQRERETSVALFNSGSRPVLVATDLAARGLDIEGVRNVVHYHQPLTPEAFTHRNGRTARVDREGDVYLLLGPDENLKDFIETDGDFVMDAGAKADLRSGWTTLYIGNGKKEKISKSDILGFLVKEGGLEGSAVGKINVYDHYALAAVSTKELSSLMKHIAGKKLKGERRKISVLE